MIYSGTFTVTSPFGMRTRNGVRENHRGIDVVGITENDYAQVAGVVGSVVSVVSYIFGEASVDAAHTQDDGR